MAASKPILRRIDTSLALYALTMALRERPFRPRKFVHYSDRVSQYASCDYTKALADNGIAISMSRKGVPKDNAYAEIFMKTRKYEEVYMIEYANIADARHQIAYFVDEAYNKKRLHSAIG